MKDEEMAEEKGNEYIPLQKQNVYARLQRKGYIDGFLEGLKAGRPQWHDLRKDPNDLPKGYAENTRFLCSVKGETLFLIRYGSFWQGNFEVDAWCEIPTFDKE